MLVLGSTWYQFDGTVGHLSSLNYLVVSLYTLHLLTLACHFAHLMYQPFGFVSWISSCITVEFFCVCCFCILFLRLALQYILVFCICLVCYYIIQFKCLYFYYFKLTVFTLHLFMVASGLKFIHFNL